VVQLRVGVIGLGMGRGHVQNYRKHPAADVVAIADADPERLKTRGDELGVAARYDSAEKMLARERLDVVSVATPNKFHKPLTLAALKAGCHVLCEKPMAMNAKEAREMVRAAATARRRLMINFSFRFTEQAWALKRQVDAGAIGDVYFGRTVCHRRRGMPGFGGWFGQKALSGGGPLIDLGVHRLDLALWLMGHPKPAYVLGATYDHLAAPLARKAGKAFDVEDLAAGFILFENGASLVVEASWAGNIADRELMETRLFGTKAGLVQRNVLEGYQFEAEMYLEKDGAQFDMKLHPPMPAVPSPMYHFIESIVTDTPHIATADDGLMVQELLDALYRSAETGKPVKVSG
jgi:predicted dehydrogenase